MKRLFSPILAAFALALLVGCAALGGPSPQSFEEKTLVAIKTVEAVQDSATTLVKAGKLGRADAENVVRTADTAMAGIAVARTVAAADPAAGQARLQTVMVVLTAMQTYLATQGAK